MSPSTSYLFDDKLAHDFIRENSMSRCKIGKNDNNGRKGGARCDRGYVVTSNFPHGHVHNDHTMVRVRDWYRIFHLMKIFMIMSSKKFDPKN